MALLLAGTSSHAVESDLARLGAYFESLRIQAGIPALAVAVVNGKDIIWEQAFGWQDVERLIATRTDTPFHLDGVTQLFTATLVLRCVEDGHLSLDDPIGRFERDAPDPHATLREILSHTSSSAGGVAFHYRPERFDLLARPVRACTDNSYRESLANLLDRLAMVDSVPGPDIIYPETLKEGIPSEAAVARYKTVLERLATPYSVDQRRRPSPSQYAATTVTPSGGLISTVRDVAKFDLALKQGILLRPATLSAAWQARQGPDGLSLPHGFGWFLQKYNDELIVWQFGTSPDASSSVVVTVPSRQVTIILLANSDGLVKPFRLAEGDVTASPFVRLFLGLILR
jgi:CubicO group peptidase (beta-lactamase class C family)